MSRGKLLVLSGPSGVGKTSVAAELLCDPRVVRVVTATTRAPRPGEVDGRDYHFLSRAEFEEGIARGRFLEHALVYGNLYGTPRRAVEEGLAAGRWVLLSIDVQGARSVRTSAADLPSVSVFLLPPSPAELERRLRGRKTEDEAVIETRLRTARAELAEQVHYDHRVVNDDLRRAAAEIVALLERAGEIVVDKPRPSE